jgi:threonine/homoserine/homoserine lactone efflux protein
VTQGSLWLFASTTFLIAVIPGPNVFFVLSQGLRSGFGAALGAIAGIALSPLVYLAVSVAGLSALLSKWPGALSGLRVAGAVYLIYLGGRMCWSALGAQGTGEPPADPASRRSGFVQGFLTSFSNPKTILYWTAFLPQFLDLARPVTPQLVLLGVLGIVMEMVVLLGYAGVATASRRHIGGPAFARRVDLFAGVFLVGLGIYLATLAKDL